jgi:hypothetical protein
MLTTLLASRISLLLVRTLWLSLLTVSSNSQESLPNTKLLRKQKNYLELKRLKPEPSRKAPLEKRCPARRMAAAERMRV